MRSSCRPSRNKRLLAGLAFALIFAPAAVFAQLVGTEGGLQQKAGGAVPQLNIPIPGLDFSNRSSPVHEDGVITVPFLAEYIAGVYRFLISIVGVVAAVMLMIGGFQYLTAGGDMGRVKVGRERIVNAIMGLVLALGSYVILYTINPRLVTFEGLKVASIRPEPLVEYEEKDEPAPNLDMQPLALDEIFKKYAGCAGVDWRVLKAIAYKESGMNTNKVNASGYVGLFQTKPANCESVLKGKTMAARCNDLTDPEVNTAVGAMMLKQAISIIKLRCGEAGLSDQFTMLYINHNMGPAVLKHASGFGCDRASLRNGSVDYYLTNARGKKTAASYAGKYRQSCLREHSGKEEKLRNAICTGGPKFDYAVETGSAMSGLGVTTLASDGGTCPL